MRKGTYNHQEIEARWQKKWDQDHLYEVDLDHPRKKFYNLIMFPYPSAAALHVGHVYCYGGADTYARFKRMQGYDVFEPMGFDAFGIHAENYAIQIKENPQVVVPRNVQHFREDQMKKLGAMFDWSREVNTTDPEYYKWTQWIFLQMHRAKLVERKIAAVDWCPGCKTVLANEQVIDGACERCRTVVEQKELAQWFFKITKYADRLLAGLDKIDWPERTKALQRHWIGKKVGIDITYRIAGQEDKSVVCFTTRPETNYGATFVVLAPEHPLVDELTTPGQKQAVEDYRAEVRKKSEMDRTDLAKDKSGVFTGSYCINDLNGQKMPIWVGDFVLSHFGSGAVVGVPAHDVRDFEFAQMAHLPVVRVLSRDGDNSEITSVEQVWEDDGLVINSDFLNGLTWTEAREAIMDHMEKNGWGKRTVSYRLHDWCVSRQRYWGPPIPMIHCEKCALQDASGQGWLPVPEKDLPVLLPKIDEYLPDGSGRGPLARAESFVRTTCPTCGGPAERETDVSDTFLDSAWYQLRYPSTDFADKPFDAERTRKWLPVDMYIGGIEHATMHLIYFRFVTMVLHDLGYLDFDEPALKLRHQGLIIKDGAKMSKSRGNVVNPDEYIKKYGADAFRTYMLFIGPYEEGGDFNDRGILGASRFFEKIWDLLSNQPPSPPYQGGKRDPSKNEGNSVHSEEMVDSPPDKGDKGGLPTVSLVKLHATIKKVGEDLENLQFNTAIAALMELGNWLKDNQQKFSAADWALINSTVPRLLAPFAPHLAEELWVNLGNPYSVHNQPWPEYQESELVSSSYTLTVQVNGKVRDSFVVDKSVSQAEVQQIAENREKVVKWLIGKTVKKVITVPGKLINIVAL